MELERHYTIRQIARRLAVSDDTVRRMIARGEHAGSLPVWMKESIERHARIVEVPNQ